MSEASPIPAADAAAPAPRDSDSSRYTVVAITLHWMIALAILLMVPLGWWMGDAIEDAETRAQGYAAFQLHKSIGLTILALSLFRLAWRLLHPPPPLPASMAGWERLVAGVTHIGLYALMIALPLSGWIYVSTGYTWDGQPLDVPTVWFGLFQVPHLPIADAPPEIRVEAALSSISAHSLLAWGALILAGLHAAAALKHHLVNRDAVLMRMAPGVPPLPGGETPAPSTRQRRVAVGAGYAVVALALIAAVGAFVSLPRGTAQSDEATAVAEQAPTSAAVESVEAPLPAEQAAEPAAAPDPTAPAPTVWVVDRDSSAIGFAGEHAGSAFDGEFADWDADIRFSPDNLASSRVVVRIQTGSADAGDTLRTTSLRAAEWFDVQAHPTATYRADRFVALGDDRYRADGTLTIKDRAIPTPLTFELRIDGDRARMEGEAVIDRVAAGMGLESDPGAEWVSRRITVSVAVRATAAP